MSEIHIHIHIHNEEPRRPKVSTSYSCRKCGKFHPGNLACRKEDLEAEMAKQWQSGSSEADSKEAQGISKYIIWKARRGRP